MTRRNLHSTPLGRRQAIGLVGAGGLGLFWGFRSDRALLAWPGQVTPASTAAFPKGAIIRTILKDIPPEALATGQTLFHEHLDGEYSRTERQLKLPPPSTADITPIVDEIRTAARDGVVCIVDGGHPDMGVNVEHLRQLSTRTGIHVVASGGYYLERTYPAEILPLSEDQIAEELVREASAKRYGAFGEIGQSPDAADPTPQERKVFRAVGKAHVRTRLPIFTHNAYGTGPMVRRDAGLRQLDLLESVGVNPQHVVVGHCCCLDDPKAEIIKQLAKRETFVGFDRVTLERFVPDAGKVTMILAFLEAGYGDRLLLSSDSRGQFGKTATQFVPKLRAAGVKEEMLHSILVDNPRRFLAFVPKTTA
jgi:predicted metal-dependent phosphotriesterase family hydrolase